MRTDPDDAALRESRGWTPPSQYSSASVRFSLSVIASSTNLAGPQRFAVLRSLAGKSLRAGQDMDKVGLGDCRHGPMNDADPVPARQAVREQEGGEVAEENAGDDWTARPRLRLYIGRPA